MAEIPVCDEVSGNGGCGCFSVQGLIGMICEVEQREQEP